MGEKEGHWNGKKEDKLFDRGCKKKRAEKIWRRYKKDIDVAEIVTPGWGKEWVDIIGELKHRWAGHVARMPVGVIVKTAMEWKSRKWWAVQNYMKKQAWRHAMAKHGN